MEARRKITLGGLWSSLYPVLVYMSIQLTASIVYMVVIVAFAAISGDMPADLEEYILNQYTEGTVLVVLLASLLTIPLFAWLYYRDTQKKKRVGWNEEWFPLTEWELFWAAIGSAALALFCNGLLSILPLEPWSDSYEEVNEALYTGSIWLRIAAVGFFGPIVEELTMRGLMYQRFRTMMRPTAAILWSALVFGLFHGNVVQGIYAFLVGLFFAWLMEHSQRILVPMLGHMAANLFIVLLEDSRLLNLFYSSTGGFLGMLVLSGIIFAWSFSMIKHA